MNSKSVAYWFGLLLFSALIVAKFSPQSGFSSLIRFGDTRQELRHSKLSGLDLATIPSSNGYDGQFYVQIALDPLLRGQELRTVLDAPAYRARRILIPAIAAALGFGNPWWTIQIYALINVFCWFIFAWLLRRHINGYDWVAYARWFACLFSMGVLESVRQSLVDLPAMVLLLLAIEAHSRANLTKSTLWLALGNLTKETSLLSGFAVLAEFFSEKSSWRRTIVAMGACTLPLVAWIFYLQYRLADATAMGSLGNFTWPFLGLLTHLKACWAELTAGNLDGRYSIGLIAALGLMLQILILWRQRQLKSVWWRIGAIHAVIFIFFSPWIWSGYWAACRVLLPMTVAFNVLLPANRAFWPLWIFGNATLGHAIWRFL